VRVLYFGTYERDYPRNAQVISCLRAAGVTVEERHVPVWESERHKFSPSLRTLARAARAQVRLARGNADGADALIVGYPGHLDLDAARRVADGRPVVFNPLVSLEDTMIGDRALVAPRSPKATALRVVDRRAFRGADLVVADTAAQARYFRDRFGLAEDRVAACYVGAEERLFGSDVRSEGSTEILFVGKLIPLHGVETILSAAELCPEVDFHVIGSGQLDHVLVSRPPNVRWDPWVEYELVPDLYRSATCALGIFGRSEKAARVIPNKAFQALATATPLITADTPAARELLSDGRDALLVPPADPEALAGAIRRVVADAGLRRDLGSEGRRTYEAHASEAVLGRRWRDLLENLLDD
jgi:glycosyltransferase involved in cell wall biosynthesis